MDKRVVWKNKVVFTLIKDGNGWKSIEEKTGLKIMTGKTIKECIQLTLSKLEKEGLKETLEAIKWNLKNKKNKEKLHSKEIATKFKKFFGVDLRLFIDGFIDCFDIIKFDKWIKTPDGISCRNHLIQKYGKDASDFVSKINLL